MQTATSVVNASLSFAIAYLAMRAFVFHSSSVGIDLCDPAKKVKKVKLSRYTPWRRLGGEEV
jgi:hypothetical protein